MNHYDYLIIGGGVAGVTAGETIRERDSAGSIGIVSEEAHPLYSRVLLPRYVKGEIERAKLFLRQKEDYAQKGIEIIFGERAARLDASGRTVELSSGVELGFGKLLVATGGRPRPLGIAGGNLKGVLRFQTLEDAEAIRNALESAEQAVVVGSGFIVLEFLDILKHHGVPTTLVMRQDHFFGRRLDEAGAKLLHEHFKKQGIGPVVVGDGPADIEGTTAVSGLRTLKGLRLPCDFIGVGIGLLRNTGWLEGSGLEISKGGVRTDEFLQASLAGVFAAGDAAELWDVFALRQESRGNWSNAFSEGQLAGVNMTARDGLQPYRRVSSYGVRSLGWTIHFIGETDAASGIKTAVRLDESRERYERFFIRNDRLVGAILINHPEAKAAYTTLIEKETAIAGALERLGDPAFDITAFAA